MWTLSRSNYKLHFNTVECPTVLWQTWEEVAPALKCSFPLSVPLPYCRQLLSQEMLLKMRTDLPINRILLHWLGHMLILLQDGSVVQLTRLFPEQVSPLPPFPAFPEKGALLCPPRSTLSPWARTTSWFGSGTGWQPVLWCPFFSRVFCLQRGRRKDAGGCSAGWLSRTWFLFPPGVGQGFCKTRTLKAVT